MPASFVASLENEAVQFFEAVGSDVKAWAGGVETIVVDDAKVAWLALWPIISAIGPTQWKILQGLVNTVNADLAQDDYAGLVQGVVAQAAAAELDWVMQLSTATLTVIVTALRGTTTPAA